MCSRNTGYCWNRAVCIDEGLVYKKWPWFYRYVFINKSPNISSKFTLTLRASDIKRTTIVGFVLWCDPFSQFSIINPSVCTN